MIRQHGVFLPHAIVLGYPLGNRSNSVRISSMQTQNLIDALHASPWQGVLAITGGGSAAISDLLSRPGASATLLEATVPYCEASLVDWISFSPKQSCSELTARQMAMASLQRACDLSRRSSDPKGESRSLFGLGATASLATDRPKRGDHRLHIAIQTNEQTATLSIELEKGKRTRAEEEGLASHAIIALLAQTAGVHAIDLTKSPPRMEAFYRSSKVDSQWSPLLQESSYGVQVDNAASDGRDEAPQLIFPGAFNPLHEGHRQMVAVAESVTNKKLWYEISLRNVDKPPLDFLDLSNRLESLNDERVLLTNAPTFVEKAKLYPQCQFVVGADTLRRIGETRYYPEREAGRDEAIESIKQAGCRFLAFGRLIDGQFSSAEQLNLSPALAELTDSVPQEQFRNDISSTEMRNKSST